MTAYAPLGAFSWPFKREQHKHLNVLKEPAVQELSAKYNRPIGQIILNWHLHRGHTVIPKTAKVERLRENITVWDFTMSEEDYEKITKLDQRARFYDPLLQKGLSWNYWPYWDE